jgi:CubicO group peptidase (beta-lactamase class C family)
VIEQLTDHVWDTAMRELLSAPLGLTHTVTLPEDALLYRSAVGHIHRPGQVPQRAAAWTLPRGLGPAGLITASAADVLAFARMHLCGGLAADGTRILSAASVAAMQQRQVVLPDRHMVRTRGESAGPGRTGTGYRWSATPG